MWTGSAGVTAFASSMMSKNLLLETVSKVNDVAIWLKPISKNMGMKQMVRRVNPRRAQCTASST